MSSNGSYGNLIDHLSGSGSTPSVSDDRSYSNDSMDVLGSGHQREREKRMKKKYCSYLLIVNQLSEKKKQTGILRSINCIVAY